MSFSKPSFAKATYTLFDDIKITFTDSGAPSHSNDGYVTLIILHGAGFVSAGFERLQTLAPANKIRIVTLNRRGYQGSTPYTEEEMNGFRAGTKESLGKMMLVLVGFLKTFVEKERIEKISNRDGERRGGIALMGWSIGVLTALSLFDLDQDEDNETYLFLEEYLRDFIVYDPPYLSFGYPLQPAFTSPPAYLPWKDQNLVTPQSVANKFLYWATSSYMHDHSTISPVSLDGYDFRDRTDECFVDSWNAEEIDKYFESGSNGLAADIAMFYTLSSHLRECTEKALFRVHSNYTSNSSVFLPNLKFSYLYAPHGPWITVWAFLETKRLCAEAIGADVARNRISFVEMKGANHCRYGFKGTPFKLRFNASHHDMPSQSTYTLCGDIKITFTDSGAPLNSNGDYVTVVIVHGVGFVATGFEQLQSLASSNNIRIVALNRRGYQGSTPYTEEELNGFHSGTESSLRGIMLYLIDFVKTLVQNEAIPRISREGNGLRGGIALMGWSIGVLTTMSIFTLNPDNDREIYAFLGEYLRDFIIYDPPYMSFGYPLHQAFTSPLAYIPWTDPKLTTPESQANQFLRWATSSYSHETQTISPTSIDGFDFRKETDECFVDSWDGADTKRFYEPDTSGLAADVGMFYTLSSHLLNCTKKALYGTQKKTKTHFFRS
ncbi:hypothetical protein VNI00_018784 [Paramarasmius palmivorus]|uniref:AB hydrolase-1 domain-containing protein n=1 Tax=Paramarasmius palmivorus TaxID=297713 RepID=A0AAW0AUM0_9AGAR